MKLIKENGFTEISLQKEKATTVPDDILRNYLTKQQLAIFKASGTGIFSITVYAEKPRSCCDSNCCN